MQAPFQFRQPLFMSTQTLQAQKLHVSFGSDTLYAVGIKQLVLRSEKRMLSKRVGSHAKENSTKSLQTNPKEWCV